MLAVPVLAQAATDLPAPYGPVLTYGPVGLFVVLYLTGQINSKRELTRETARADRAETQRDKLADQLLTETVPLITEVQRTMVPTLERLAAEVARMSERIDRLDQRTTRS